jgi:hypothetical protein
VVISPIQKWKSEFTVAIQKLGRGHGEFSHLDDQIEQGIIPPNHTENDHCAFFELVEVMYQFHYKSKEECLCFMKSRKGGLMVPLA